MSSRNPYQTLGVGIAPLLGRRVMSEKIMRHLANPGPWHLTIVGPKYIGKTVLLKALASQVSEDRNLFEACVFWDVRHSHIETDADFYRELAIHAAEALKPVDGLLSEELSKPEGRNYGAIRDVFEYLKEDGRRVLLIWDGMDRVLSAAQVTRNLWDSLRSLAELSSVRIITGSRKYLRELCATPESRTSDFWRSFHDPVKLGAFTEEDWDDFLEPFATRQINLARGARTEIVNWTGGAPVLAAALCARLWATPPNDTAISNMHINEIAGAFFAGDETLLPALWADCDLDERSDLARLASGDSLRIKDDVPQPRAQALQQRGYVRVENNQISFNCRAIENYARQHGSDATALRRLFGIQEEYEKNLVGLLELRSGRLNLSAGDLNNQLTIAIQNVASSPATSIRQVRGLVDDIFEMIWDAELPDRRIPAEWSDAWNENGWGLRGDIPTEGGARCKLLGNLTDKRKAGSTRVSRQSYTLLNFLQSVGDVGQHRNNEQISSSFAAIACLTVIELLGQLTSELNSARNLQTF
jgi:hypothetical protein